MIHRRIPGRGDVYWVDPNPVQGREMKDRHRFVVITPKEINALGVSMMVPITVGGGFPRATGLTVPIQGFDAQGVAVCCQARAFDLQAREAQGTVRYVESLDNATVSEIVNRVLSIIDPSES